MTDWNDQIAAASAGEIFDIPDAVVPEKRAKLHEERTEQGAARAGRRARRSAAEDVNGSSGPVKRRRRKAPDAETQAVQDTAKDADVPAKRKRRKAPDAEAQAVQDTAKDVDAPAKRKRRKAPDAEAQAVQDTKKEADAPAKRKRRKAPDAETQVVQDTAKEAEAPVKRRRRKAPDAKEGAPDETENVLVPGGGPEADDEAPQPKKRGRRRAKRGGSSKGAPHGRRKHKHRKKRLSTAALTTNLVLATCIAVMVALGGILVYRHNVFVGMKQAVEAQTFYEGTTVEGVDVSDMTLAQAEDHWRKQIEPGYALRTVQLDDGSAVTAEQLGYQSDYEAVLFNAWSAGRRGSLEQRYRAVVHRESHPVAYQVGRRLYSPSALSSYVDTLSSKLDVPAVNAGIASFDKADHRFVFTESQTGRRLDAEGLKQQIVSAIKAGGGSASIHVETVQPEVTTEAVQDRYGMIAYAVTNASSSASNRIKNIKLAMSFIDGKCLKPGEVFSFNDTVGKRTSARGFRMAKAYSSGEVIDEVGGGICQVSTTLFNAAVKSDLEIVERHNHSLTVSYVDKGKDATVNWRSQDLRFKNTSDDDVYIGCYLSKDKRVRFAIFGKLLENGETITVETETTKVKKYDTKYVANPELPSGQSRVVEPGKNGFKAEAYKVRWDANGNQISRELLCKSTYKAQDAVVEFGP